MIPYYTNGVSFVPIYDPRFKWVDKHYKGEVREILHGDVVTQESHPFAFYSDLVAQLVSRHKKLHDIFHIGQIFCVSDRFRNLIEKFEPNTHKFFEVNLLDKSGTRFTGRYYLFNICTSIDALIIEKSSLKKYYSADGTRFSVAERGGDRFRCLSKVVTQNKHIWFDMRTEFTIYVSDALFAQIKREKIAGFEEFQFASVE